MSWKGFLCILRDFNIAACPSKKTKLGKLFPRELWDSDSLPCMITAPLSMEEVAVIFIESSRTAHPTIVLHKFLPQYLEIAASLKQDPYREAAEWIDREDWNIQSGLNFSQFIDAMAKCGALAYSSDVFKEALPTIQDRIEHFFSAHLGLTETEKWRRKIENKIVQASKAVAALRSSVSSSSLPVVSEKKKNTKLQARAL